MGFGEKLATALRWNVDSDYSGGAPTVIVSIRDNEDCLRVL